VSLFMLGGASAGTTTASAVSFDCAVGNTQPCIRYCYVNPDGGGQKYPCGVSRVPSLTGTYSFSVPMDTATQNATGVAGDPGASGTANITLDLSNNRFCATTTWTGVDSTVAGGHIHQGHYGQPENPGVWISLMPFDPLNGNQSGVSYCETVPAGELWLIKECPQEFHTVIHSKNHVAGAIRGQIGTTCTPYTTG
jgi:hypothetical protein